MRFFLRLSGYMIIALCVLIFSTTIEAEAAKRNDLKLANLAALTTVDPHATRNLHDILIMKQLYEGLYWQNERTGEFVPRIAESYARSEDNLRYTFKIRPNAKFHNGDPVKASDVVFSLMRAKGMVLGSLYGRDIDSVEAVDDQTAKVILKKPSAAFMTNISNLYILSEKEVRAQGDLFGTKINLAGTGPYFLTYLDRAVKWDFQAFDDYYRGPAPIKQVHYTVIPDSSAGIITFESGELDYYMAPIADFQALKDSGKYNAELVPANHISYFMVNPLRAPLSNDKLREAIAYAIDKEAMNIACFDGNAEIAKFMEKPGVNVGAPLEGVYFEYDPEKARKLVIEAGYEKGVNIGKILTIAGNYYEKMAQVMQANLAEVGISAEVMPLETSATLLRSRTQDFDITCNGHYSTGDFENLRRFIHTDSKGGHYVKFEGDKFDYKKFDDLLDRGGAELDSEKRAALYREVNDLVMRTFTFLPMFHRSNPHVWAKNLRATMYPNNPQLYEWSWAD